MRAANGEGGISEGDLCSPALGNVVAIDNEGFVDPHKLPGWQLVFKIFERNPRYEAAAVVQVDRCIIAVGFKPFDRVAIDMRNGSFQFNREVVQGGVYECHNSDVPVAKMTHIRNSKK